MFLHFLFHINTRIFFLLLSILDQWFHHLCSVECETTLWLCELCICFKGITNESVELGMWNFMWRLITDIGTNFKWTILFICQANLM